MGVKEANFMSESNLVSPLLDGFVLGSPMSSRPGVCCCPAMKQGSDQKYIVKILSFPASQTQLDALLVTGAYKDPAAALDYYRQVADDAAAEAEFLQSMAKLEGFQSYEGWQVAPMKKNRLGYHVYLVSRYGRTLEKVLRRTAITHAQAVNLGLDLCAALSLCRRAGHLYVDLKPTNVMLDETGHYKIADLGFVSVKFLDYTSMPEKYLSSYCAPEARDPMATLNMTMDTYALGMILYRIYNGGILPDIPEDPARPFEAPRYADEEMTAIILRALSPAKEDRWQDPADLGQALAAYQQSAVPADTPIAPPAPEKAPEPEQTPEAEAPQENDAETLPETEEEVPPADTIPESAVLEEASVETIAGSDSTVSDSTIRMDFQEAAVQAPSQAVLDQGTVRFSPGAVAAAEKPRQEDDVVFPVISTGNQEDFDLDSELDAVKDLLKTPKYPEMRPRPVRKPVMQNVTPVDVEKNRRGKAPLVAALVLVLLLAAGAFSYWFYNNYYLVSVSGISVTGSQSELTVSLNTEIADSLLTVSCTDAYGNTLTAPVSGKAAVFTGLSPNAL